MKPKGKVCKLVVRPAMLYGAEEVRMPADHLVCHAVLALGQRDGSPYQPGSLPMDTPLPRNQLVL